MFVCPSFYFFSVFLQSFINEYEVLMNDDDLKIKIVLLDNNNIQETNLLGNNNDALGKKDIIACLVKENP